METEISDKTDVDSNHHGNIMFWINFSSDGYHMVDYKNSMLLHTACMYNHILTHTKRYFISSCEYFGHNWLCYNGAMLYLRRASCNPIEGHMQLALQSLIMDEHADVDDVNNMVWINPSSKYWVIFLKNVISVCNIVHFIYNILAR